MTRNQGLAGAGWYEIRRQREYKAALRGLVDSREELQVADGSAANAAPSRNVMQTPQSTQGTS
jgi:hypothetical protein